MMNLILFVCGVALAYTFILILKTKYGKKGLRQIGLDDSSISDSAGSPGSLRSSPLYGSMRDSNPSDTILHRHDRILSAKINPQSAKSTTKKEEVSSDESLDDSSMMDDVDLNAYGTNREDVPDEDRNQEYFKINYSGYSSFLPEGDADADFFGKTPVQEETNSGIHLSNWNRRFRKCLKNFEKLEDNQDLQLRINANLNLMHLAQDFIYAASSYAKIIISEYYLPYQFKTIKPVQIGGVLGGQKYIVHNILFKFAVDYNGLFGSDFSAAKVAGNELRGLISYFNCHIPKLHMPLMALVDYRGFRVIAMSVLPVDHDSIRYGSCDAGRSIHATDKELNLLMEKAAKMLNLKPHLCRIAKQESRNYTKEEEAERKKVIFQEVAPNLMASRGDLMMPNNTNDAVDPEDAETSEILETISGDESLGLSEEEGLDDDLSSDKNNGKIANNRPFLEVPSEGHRLPPIYNHQRRLDSSGITFLPNPYQTPPKLFAVPNQQPPQSNTPPTTASPMPNTPTQSSSSPSTPSTPLSPFSSNHALPIPVNPTLAALTQGANQFQLVHAQGYGPNLPPPKARRKRAGIQDSGTGVPNVAGFDINQQAMSVLDLNPQSSASHSQSHSQSQSEGVDGTSVGGSGAGSSHSSSSVVPIRYPGSYVQGIVIPSDVSSNPTNSNNNSPNTPGRQNLAQASAYVSSTSIKTTTKQLRESESRLCESGEKVQALSEKLRLGTGSGTGISSEENIMHDLKKFVEQGRTNMTPKWNAPLEVDEEKKQLMANSHASTVRDIPVSNHSTATSPSTGHKPLNSNQKELNAINEQKKELEKNANNPINPSMANMSNSSPTGKPMQHSNNNNSGTGSYENTANSRSYENISNTNSCGYENSAIPISGGYENATFPISGGYENISNTNSCGYEYSAIPISGGYENATFPISGGYENSAIPISGGYENISNTNSGGYENATFPISGGYENAGIPSNDGYENTGSLSSNLQPCDDDIDEDSISPVTTPRKEKPPSGLTGYENSATVPEKKARPSNLGAYDSSLTDSYDPNSLVDSSSFSGYVGETYTNFTNNILRANNNFTNNERPIGVRTMNNTNTPQPQYHHHHITGVGSLSSSPSGISHRNSASSAGSNPSNNSASPVEKHRSSLSSDASNYVNTGATYLIDSHRKKGNHPNGNNANEKNRGSKNDKRSRKDNLDANGRTPKTKKKKKRSVLKKSRIFSDSEVWEDQRMEMMYSAADLEGHLGMDDCFYLLDFSRTQPPETPHPAFKNSHLSRLLRPEFSQQYPKALCADAFSGFIRGTPLEQEHNKEIEEATNHLINVLVPKVGRELKLRMQDARAQGVLHQFRLTETAHSFGVNCRHFGRLRKVIDDPEFKQIVLMEIVSRCIKNNMRWKFREKMKKIKLPMEEPYRLLVITYFNLVFGNHKNSDRYWNEWLKRDCEINFPDTFSPEELSSEFHFKLRGLDGSLNENFLHRVFQRVIEMLGMKFSFAASKLFICTKKAPFDDTDLEHIGEKVKDMNYIAHARGYFFHIKGLSSRVESPEASKKFYALATAKYEEALNSDPNNKEILLSMALTYQLMVEDSYQHIPNAKFEMSDYKVQKAQEYSLRAIKAEPAYDACSLFRYAQFLEKCGKMDSAQDYYLMALEADPNNAACLISYGTLLAELNHQVEAEKFFWRASANTQGITNLSDL